MRLTECVQFFISQEKVEIFLNIDKSDVIPLKVKEDKSGEKMQISL